MLAFPLAPISPRLQCEFDDVPRAAAIFHKMNTQSSEVPSPPSITPSIAASMPGPQAPPSRKRPKLSLQTSGVPITFGKSSTAMTLAASGDPAASPTVLNTFNNAYELPHRLSPAAHGPGPFSPSTGGPRSARTPSRLISPFASNRKDDRPYQVPSGLKSILRNGPILCSTNTVRRSSFCPSTTPGSPHTARKAFFPATKKVAFRSVLDEEIQTTTYVAKHSDLTFSEDGEGERAGEGNPAPSSSSSSAGVEEDEDEEEKSHSNPDSGSDSDSESASDSDPASTSNPIQADSESKTQEPTEQETQKKKKTRRVPSQRQIEAAAIRDHIQPPSVTMNSSSSSSHRGSRRWEWTL